MLLRKCIAILLLTAFGVVTGHDIIPHSHQEDHHHHHTAKAGHSHHHHHDSEDSSEGESEKEDAGLLAHLLSHLSHASPASVAVTIKADVIDVKKQDTPAIFILSRAEFVAVDYQIPVKAPPDIGVSVTSCFIYSSLSLRAPPALFSLVA
jgi:hypothetical protein